MPKNVSKIFVAGDWDADGIVSTALLVYSQEKLNAYPLKSTAIVHKKPVDPERIKYIFGDLSGNYDLLVFLDLPYTSRIPKILNILKKHFGIKKIMYIDHHLSSLTYQSELEKVVDELILDHKNPTAVIVYKLLKENGITIHSRLRSFVEVIKYMDSGRKVPNSLMKLFELTKLFSKALTITRDEELWIKIVDWLASPTPLPMPLEESVLNRVKKIIEERDRKMQEIALDLAVSSMKVGIFRFIDARDRWRYRGSSALASKLASILKAPVILLVDTNKPYSLLVIKALKGQAYRVAKQLLAEGIALDIAGHPNLAIVKVPKNIDKDQLIEILYRISFYV
ncbi:MAG: phosphoesterase [Desulfurococcales archaeon ex4484_58]|nr:MAG: phosphoesterase [Desulfurococcales archaeon ex4484_58]